MYGDNKQFTVRAAAILTGSYVAGTTINLNDTYFNQLILNAAFTKGSLTTGDIKVEFSKDGTTYFQESIGDTTTTAGTDAVSLLVHKLGADGNYRLAIPILPGEQYIKISAIGTGTATGSSLAINATLANV